MEARMLSAYPRKIFKEPILHEIMGYPIGQFTKNRARQKYFKNLLVFCFNNDI